MTPSATNRECQLTCRSFFCSKKMLRIVTNNGQKVFICTMDDGECLGYMCNFAECRDRKMSDSGKCLKPQQTQQSKSQPQKRVPYAEYDYMTPNELDDKLRKKIAKKF